jgi:murein DD-endopeptidase MepM/ murein hydrolase activator NlpD
MTSLRRLLTFSPAFAVLVCASLTLVAFASAGSAGADTGDDLTTARQTLAHARDAANAAAAAFSQADHELEETRDSIAKLRDSIAATKARAAELRDYARQRAVFAYTHPGTSLEALVDAVSSVDAARRQRLLDQANQTDSDVVKRLAAANAALKAQQGDLERREHDQAAVSDELDAKLVVLQANQRDVEQAVSDLQAKLDAEIAAAQRADAARKAQLEAEKAALAAQQTVASAGPGQIVANPVPGAFHCPVRGAAYSDDYGGPSGHPGIDMMVPVGTPAVAVMAGTVRYVPNEGAGGNTAYLEAVDGNTYFYAHFSQFVGEGRRVAQGEVIGLTGMTGNASAPHLHFEIRVGGDNGNTTDPYRMLKAAGC